MSKQVPPTAPLMLEEARGAGAAVETLSVGTATVFLVEGPPGDAANRAYDVDPREPGVVVAIVDALRAAGRRPLLEIDAALVSLAVRDSLRGQGLERLWGVAEFERDLASIGAADEGGIAIRDVGPDDAEWFGALAEDAYGEPPAFLGAADPPTVARRWSAFARRGIARCIAAEIDGVPCAVAVSFRVGEVALVDGAATLPSHRGRGCQQALLHHRFEIARREGARCARTRTAEGSGSQRNLERGGMRLSRRLDVWGTPRRP